MEATQAHALLLVTVAMGAMACGGNPLLTPARPQAEFDAQACVERALRGDPDLATLPLALAKFTAECAAGDAAACSTLGVMHERGLATRRDPLAAAGLYHRACTAGNVAGCTNLALAYNRGDGVTQDYARGRELLGWSCGRGHARGCAELGTLYGLGRGVARDDKAAASLYQQACDGRDADGCYRMAAMYEHGAGVGHDTMRALTGYEVACVGGIGPACEALARVHAEKPAMAQPTVHPRQARCEGGDAAACAAVGLAYFQGDRVPKDIGQAVSFLERACSGGYGAACSVLAPTLQGSCQRGEAASCSALSRLAARAGE